MRRLTLLSALAAVVAAPSAGLAQREADQAPARATLVACRFAREQADRIAVFGAEMSALPGTDRMWVRFDLLQRLPGRASFAPVDAPGLGVWRRSRPGVATFRYRKRVTNLAAPAAYRALVRFRWYGADGRLLAESRRTTPACRQPDYRPDLRIVGVTAARAVQPGMSRYAVLVRNRGLSPAPDFDVLLAVDGTAVPAETAPGLAAGARRTVEIVAPSCAPGGRLQLAVDPDGRVPEANEGNNTLRVPCPA